ncbi:radical SAM protein [Patescibacteria group bacterium]
MKLSDKVLRIGLDRDYALLISGLSGRVDLVKTVWWERVKKAVSQNKPLPKKEAAALKKGGYLFASIAAEKKFFQKVAQNNKQAISKDKSYSVVINFSEGCNLACPYCVNKDQRNRKIMTPKHLDQILTIVDRWLKKGQEIKTVNLFGGEPLRRETKLLFEKLLPEVKKRKLKVKIFTNGVEIQEFASLLKKYRSLLLSLQITVDGPEKIHDQRRVGPGYPQTFQLIMSNIEWLLKNKIPVSLRTNVEQKNFPFLPQLASEISKRKWSKNKFFSCHLGLVCADEPCFAKTNPKARNVKFVQKYRRLLKKHPQMKVFQESGLYSFPERFLKKALAGKENYRKIAFCKSCGGQSFTFASDGQIYACMASVGISAFCLGSYWPKLVWDKKVLKKWQARFSPKMKKCRSCSLVFICGGECPLASFKHHGDINEPYCREAVKNLTKFAEISKKKIMQAGKTNLKRKKQKEKLL